MPIVPIAPIGLAPQAPPAPPGDQAPAPMGPWPMGRGATKPLPPFAARPMGMGTGRVRVPHVSSTMRSFASIAARCSRFLDELLRLETLLRLEGLLLPPPRFLGRDLELLLLVLLFFFFFLPFFDLLRLFLDLLERRFGGGFGLAFAACGRGGLSSATIVTVEVSGIVITFGDCGDCDRSRRTFRNRAAAAGGCATAGAGCGAAATGSGVAACVCGERSSRSMGTWAAWTPEPLKTLPLNELLSTSH